VNLRTWRGVTRFKSCLPDPSLIGRWRTLLTSDEVKRFEDVAGDLLGALGYDGPWAHSG
jgi:hypothetical protein